MIADRYDAFLFETQGDLTQLGVDKQPPMRPEGKNVLLKAIAAGKGFVGCHCASDTFHSPGQSDKNQDAAHIDPYIAMLGGEFIRHGSQQTAWMRVVDNRFPGFNYEVQGVYQERIDGRIKFHTYVVQA